MFIIVNVCINHTYPDPPPQVNYCDLFFAMLSASCCYATCMTPSLYPLSPPSFCFPLFLLSFLPFLDLSLHPFPTPLPFSSSFLLHILLCPCLVCVFSSVFPPRIVGSPDGTNYRLDINPFMDTYGPLRCVVGGSCSLFKI